MYIFSCFLSFFFLPKMCPLGPLFENIQRERQQRRITQTCPAARRLILLKWEVRKTLPFLPRDLGGLRISPHLLVMKKIPGELDADASMCGILFQGPVHTYSSENSLHFCKTNCYFVLQSAYFGSSVSDGTIVDPMLLCCTFVKINGNDIPPLYIWRSVAKNTQNNHQRNYNATN